MKSLAILSVLLLTACAQGANHQNMTYNPPAGTTIAISETASFNVESVSGGEETNPLWTSEIDSLSFKMALENTLKNLGIYEAINSKYDIQVFLKEVDQPLFGLTFTVKTFVEYEVIDRQTRQPVFREILNADGTATFSDSAIAINRLKIANERAGQENIKAFISKLTEKFPS